MADVRIFPPIYRREFLGDQEVYVQIDNKHVHLPALLERIPREILSRAVESLEREGKVLKRSGMEINPGTSFPEGLMTTPEMRDALARCK